MNVTTLRSLRLNRDTASLPAASALNRGEVTVYRGTPDLLKVSRLAADGATYEWADMLGGSNPSFSGRLDTAGTAPTPAVGAALGTGGSVAVAVVGNDIAGSVTATAGAAGMAAGVLLTLTFAAARPGVAYVVLIQDQGLTAQGIGSYQGGRTSGSFDVRCTGVPAAGVSYQFGYIVIGY